MDRKYYTVERNVQIVISLLKAHGIKRVIASPGTTNMTFVGSIQQDPFFELFSSICIDLYSLLLSLLIFLKIFIDL